MESHDCLHHEIHGIQRKKKFYKLIPDRKVKAVLYRIWNQAMNVYYEERKRNEGNSFVFPHPKIYQFSLWKVQGSQEGQKGLEAPPSRWLWPSDKSTGSLSFLHQILFELAGRRGPRLSWESYWNVTSFKWIGRSGWWLMGKWNSAELFFFI